MFKKLAIAFIAMFLFMPVANAGLKCGDAKVVIKNNSYDQAYYDPMTHKIVMNKKFLNQYNKNVQQFIFDHECGHAMGALDEVTGEYDADRFAFKASKKRGGLSKGDVNAICASLDWDYQRCTRIQQMYLKGK